MVVEFKEVLILYISTTVAKVIPKRFFNSDEDYSYLKDIIKAKVSKGKVKIK